MIDAAAFDQKETLKNGIAVRIRSVRADDKQRFVEAFRNLEPESIYTRFFYPKKELTAPELKAATEVDFVTAVALVVTIGSEGNETIIGAGRYVAFKAANGRRSAEIAFTVEEDYHGQGIASRLLKHLVSIAREKGVDQFEARMLRQNKAMLAVFSHSGLPMAKRSEFDGVHVTLTLKEATA